MGGSSTTVQKSETDPQIKALILGNYADAQRVANTPFEAYSGQRVADFNDPQKQAQAMVGNIAANNTGAVALSQAGDIYRDLAKYAPQAISSPGNLNAQTVASRNISGPMIASPGTLNVGKVNPYAVAAPDTIQSPGTLTADRISAPVVNAAMLRDTDLSPYMNKYQQDVIDASMTDLSRQRDMQRVADNQAATASKAFGGSRHGVADSLSNDAYLRNVASTTANLRSQGYQNAQNAAMADLNRQFGADTFNADKQFGADSANVGNRLASDQFNLQTLLNIANANAQNRMNVDLFNSGQAYDAGKTNVANQFGADQLNLSNLMDILKTNAGYQFGADQFNSQQAFDADKINAAARMGADQFNLASLLDINKNNAANDLAGAGLRLNAGGQLADLSQAELTQALQRAGALAASGDVMQQNQQAKLDADYAEFIRRLNYPILMQQLKNGTVGTLPNDGTSTSRQSQSLGLGSILGGIGSLGAAFVGSDRRLKEDIKRVGALASGLPVYSFRFKDGDGATVLGVMADEAEQLFPDAVVTGADGFKRVHYGRIG